MKLRACVTLISVFAASAAFSGECGGDRAADIPVFEEAKSAFLASDYVRFVDAIGDYFPDVEQNFDAYFGQLERALPDGFSRCATILQRREEPGFAQDLVLYFPKGSDSPMALLLIAAEVDGAYRMIEFTYNTSISSVLEEIK